MPRQPRVIEYLDSSHHENEIQTSEQITVTVRQVKTVCRVN